MSTSDDSTRNRLLELIKYKQATEHGRPLSFNDMAQTLGVSRERIRQLYRTLIKEYALPPAIERRSRSAVINKNGPTQVGQKPKSPQTLQLEADVRNLMSQKLSIPEVARQLGRSPGTIYDVVHRLGIPFDGRALRSKTPNPKTLALEKVVRKLHEQGLNTPQIMEKTGKSEKTILKIHHKLDLPLLPKRKKPQTLALEEEVKYLSTLGYSTAEIVKRTGHPSRTIYSVLSRLQIPRRHKLEAGRKKSAETLKFEKAVKELSQKGLTVAEIAHKTEKPFATVYKALRRLGLPYLRSLKQKAPTTREFEFQVRRLFREGLTPPEIAAALGRDRTSVYEACRRLRLPFRRSESPQTQVLVRRIKFFLETGSNVSETARLVGKPRSTVRNIIIRYGIPLRI